MIKDYIYSKLINNLPWGLSAVQRASSIVNEKENENNNVLVPAYIYFGVNTEEAVAFCMLGVPRFVAEDIGEYWRKNNGKLNLKKLSYLKQWMKSLDKEKWINCFRDKKKGELSYNLWKKNN